MVARLLRMYEDRDSGRSEIMPTGVYDRTVRAKDRTEKNCFVCGRVHPISEFYKNRAKYDGYQGFCKTCHAKRSRDWKEIDLKRKYDMGNDDYQSFLEAQGGRCAICGEVPGDTSLAVDHDHETGKVRGLLCFKCNTALGMLGDSREMLLEAAAYLG